MTQHLKVWKAFIYPDDVGQILICDVIFHEDAFWLVPQWLEAPAEGFRIPARLIRMGGLPVQETPTNPNADFLVNTAIPRALLELQPLTTVPAGFVVVESPSDIRRPLPSRVPPQH